MMKMKYYSLCFGVLAPLFCTVHTHAQDVSDHAGPMQHELRLQVQDGIPISLGVGITEVVLDIFSAYNRETIRSTSSPVIGLGYRYHVSKAVNVGVLVSYMQDLSKYRLTDRYTGAVRYGSRRHTYLSITPTFEVSYFKSPMVDIYGNLALGVLILRTNGEIAGGRSTFTTLSMVDFQVNPIGVRVGKQVAGYFELGFGMKGFATLGLSVSL